MGRALLLPHADPLWLKHPKLEVQKGPYSYTLAAQDGQATYSVTDGKDTLSVPVRWVFGEASQTFVIERDGKFYESLVSYYPLIDGLDTTMGDQRLHPETLLQAMGRELSTPELHACVGCHATGTEAGHHFELTNMQPGVQCEHCHAGAEKHFVDIARGNLSSMPPRLKQLSAEQISNFCGQCHRSWETVVRDGLQGEINVRFQPYRLANSKCFDGSDPRISCIACHDPHQNLAHEETSYDAKCLACHGTSAARPKPCPIAKSGCVSCHMPKISLPGGHQVFTDHDIRIEHANEPYPN